MTGRLVAGLANTAAAFVFFACGNVDRDYKGRSAEAWAAQLSAAAPEDRTAAADALYQIAPRSEVALSALLQAMRDPNDAVQRSVAAALSTAGPRALPGLIEAIGDDHASVRALAIELLANQGRGSEAAIPRIGTALADADENVRRAAAMALAMYGESARSTAPQLAKAARSGTPDSRAAAIVALSAVHADTSAVISLLQRALKDSAAVVRRAAIKAVLMTINDPAREFTLLVPLSRDRDTSVRLESYRAMGVLLGDQGTRATAHAALIRARADPDSSARRLVQQLLDPAPRPNPREERFGRVPRGVVVTHRP